MIANDANVKITLGGFAKLMPEVLADLQQPGILWQDDLAAADVTGKGEIEGHILISLKQIAEHAVGDYVIFVDDARMLDGREGRPDSLEVFVCIKKTDSRYIILMQSDIIVATVEPLPVSG